LGFKKLEPELYQISLTVFFSLAMWAPGIAALLTIKSSGGSIKDLNLKHLGPKRYYLWAWFLFPILSALTGLVTVLFRVAEFDPAFSLITQSLASLPEEVSLDPAMIVTLQVGAAIIIAPLFNMLFALGEELGWRGFLLPKLMPLGKWKAIILSNVIWGFWHAPAIVQGHNYPGYPVLGIFMMVALTVLVGIILSWLYLETKSPWTPALAHGSMNAVASLSLLFLVPGFDLAMGGTLASVMGWIPLAAFVLWLIYTGRMPIDGKN
jgi:membrane protease YdiL (CAAX protease family)